MHNIQEENNSLLVKINKYLDQLNFINKSPELFIIEYVDEIINEIDIAAESLILKSKLRDDLLKKLNENRSKMIERLEQFKKESLKKLIRKNSKLKQGLN